MNTPTSRESCAGYEAGFIAGFTRR